MPWYVWLWLVPTVLTEGLCLQYMALYMTHLHFGFPASLSYEDPGAFMGALFGAFLIWGLYSITNFQNDFLPSRVQFDLFNWKIDLDIAGRLFGPLRVIIIAIALELILIYRPRGLLGEEKQVSALMKS